MSDYPRLSDSSVPMPCEPRHLDAVERKTAQLALRAVYDAERKQEGRNYAKEHSFEEWLEH